MDRLRIERAGRHDLLDFGHRHLAGGRHVRVEVARRAPVDEIAGGVGLPGLDDRDIGPEPGLANIELPLEFLDRLALGDDGADAGLGVEGGDAGAAGTDALGQRALRVELKLKLAAEILLLEQLVLADIGRDHLPDLPGLQQHPQAEAVGAGIV